MVFDMTTSLYATLLIFLVSFFTSLIVFLNHQKERRIYIYVLFMYGFYTLGFLLILLRPYLITFLTIIVADSLIFFAGLCSFYAVLKLLNKQVSLYLYIVSFTLFLIPLLYFTYVHIHASMRIVVFSLGQVFWFGHLLYLLLKDKQHEKRLMIIATTLIICNLLISMVVASTKYNDSLSLFDQNSSAMNTLMMSVFGTLFLFAIEHIIGKQKDEQLLENEKSLNFLYKIYYTLPIPVMILDEDLTITKMNRGCCSAERETTLHKKLDELFEVKTAMILQQEITELGEEKDNTVCTIEVKKQEKETALYEVTIQVVFDGDQKFFVLFFREKYQHEKSFLKQYDLLLEETESITSIGFWEIDLRTGMIHADSKAREIYEMQDYPYDIPLKEVQKVVLSAYRPIMDKALQALIEEEKRYDVMFEILTKNGSKRHIHSKASLVKKGGRNLVVGTVQDVTSFKMIEQEVTFLKEHDSTTGFLLREVFEEKMYEYVSVDNVPITILISDMSNLSELNKLYGYSYGSKLLLESAQLFEQMIGENAVYSRISEESFAFLLLNTDETKTEELIAILEDAFHKRYSVAKNHKVTWSYGYATLKDVLLPIKDTYNQAISHLEKYKSYYNQARQTKSLDAIMQTLFEKDPLSELHSTRVAYYAKRLASEYGMSKSKIAEIETAALLHDIGKILIEDTILKSDTTLADEEYEILKHHPITSYNILSAIPEMKDIAKMVLAHHERIDGNGYPYHLKGQSIPFESKIISIADAYDAMTGKRNYREPYVKEEAILELLEHRGTQFDEELVNVFVDMLMKQKKESSS